MEYLSQEQITEMKEAFELFDKDGDGEIKSEEMAEVLKSMGMDDKDIKVMVQEVDTDQDGYISFEEYITMMAKRMLDQENVLNSVARKAFEKMDEDKDGYISAQELGRAMRFIGEPMPRDELEAMLQMADFDDDGRVGVEDFLEIMRSVEANPSKS